MERHRCTQCRNPIRSVAVSRPGRDEWFHPDCWEEVCTSEQRKYEQQVESTGLTALLAPYLSRSSLGGPEPQDLQGTSGPRQA